MTYVFVFGAATFKLNCLLIIFYFHATGRALGLISSVLYVWDVEFGSQCVKGLQGPATERICVDYVPQNVMIGFGDKIFVVW